MDHEIIKIKIPKEHDTFWLLKPADILSINKDISHSISIELETWEAEHLASFLNQLIKDKLT